MMYALYIHEHTQALHYTIHTPAYTLHVEYGILIYCFIYCVM